LTQGRRPWVAAALSVVAPGTGHFYDGDPGRGAAAWFVAHLVRHVGLWSILLSDGRLALVGYLASWAVAAAVVAIDAGRRALAAPPAPRAWWDRWAVYLAAVPIAIIASSLWMTLIDGRLVGAMRIRTDAMAPTFMAGDRLFASPIWIPHVRGDLVVYRFWQTRYVKRIAGVPGDTLAMRDGVLRVDGRVVTEPYAVHTGESDVVDRRFAWQRRYLVQPAESAGYAPTLRHWGPIVVPARNYFVLGDNRGETSDSRYIGFVEDSALIARPLAIYFARDPRTGRVRWERIGSTPSRDYHDGADDHYRRDTDSR